MDIMAGFNRKIFCHMGARGADCRFALRKESGLRPTKLWHRRGHPIPWFEDTWIAPIVIVMRCFTFRMPTLR
jgi:hypothetical protein